MKPLNFDNSPCSPTSSNCVIWAGPDLACINVCKGDNITDVTAKLATEICGILDTLNINSYDLDCFNLTNCPPQTFQDLINFLIAKICELENLPSTPVVPGTGDCPTNCIVEVAACFIENGVTTMSLTDYAIAIGEKLCALVDTVNLQQIAINDLDIRVTTLENTPPPAYTTPTMTMGCTIPSTPPLNAGSVQAINVVLRSFINDIWCSYVSTTGDAGCLAAAVANQTVAGTDPSKANPSATMAIQYAGLWVEPATTVCDSINNIWASIEDLRNADTFEVVDTNTINLTYSSGTLSAVVQDTGWQDLLGFAYMSSYASRPQCRRIGNEILFRGVIQIPMGNTGSGATGTAIAVNSPDEYFNIAYGKTLDAGLTTDPDACLIYASGNIPSTNPSVDTTKGITAYFNRGVRVIPSSVLNVSTNPDATYGTSRKIVNRSIIVSEGTVNVFLATHVGLFISSTGTLGITSPYNVENYNGNGVQNSSILRSITSNIIAGENIPLYTNTAPSNSNAPSAAAYQVDINGSSITWPFSMNCNNAFELGGFSVRIDELRCFISPCEAAQETPTPCI